MANEIKLITFADSEVSATDDAYVYETATGDGGVINGCAVTIKNASQLHITGGNGILCGRKFTVYDSDINVTLSSSGTLLGRLYIHMDLSNASTPIQLMVETGASLTPVVQDDDVNATNGIFEVNLATFNVSTSTISDLADVAPKASPINVLSTVAECVASTNPGDVAGASVVSELNSNFFKELWSNPTPNVNFNAQTVPLSDGGYSLFLIVANRMVGETRQVSVISDGNGYLSYTGCGSGGVVAFARGFDKTDSTHISFDTAQYAVGATSAQADQSRLIPVKVYGIK